MSDQIICSVEQAIELLSHMKKDDTVILTVLNVKTLQHGETERIKRPKGEELIRQAKMINYQNNDYFGRLSLLGIVKDKNIIHNILFPQLE